MIADFAAVKSVWMVDMMKLTEGEGREKEIIAIFMTTLQEWHDRPLERRFYTNRKGDIGAVGLVC
jgi:hypothetical protein